jgi:signal transduction histidine kinase/ActR/RegA family two-component response regulator
MKLRTKFLISMALVTTTLTAASMYIVWRSVGLHARQEIMASFNNSSATLCDFQAKRETAAQHYAELLAEIPFLKAMMITQDPLTVQDASAPLWQSSGADLLVLSDPSGQLLAVHSKGEPLPEDKLHNLALLHDEGTNWWLVGNRLYEVVARPIQAGPADENTHLGTLVLGYEVTPATAQEIGSIADGDIAFLLHDRVVASTLTPRQRHDLPTSLFTLADTSRTTEVELAGERFLARIIHPASGPDDAELVVLKSYDKATLYVQQMNRLLLIVGLVVIVFGTGAVFLVFHTFTQPLDELLKGVRALGKGDFTFALHTRGKDEVAELTSAFDGMRQSLQVSQERMVTSARLEAVGQLAGGVAHDFNNLITVIKGYADLLASQIRPGDPLMKYADQISKAGDRASSLTRQLLAFSRKQVIEPQAIDLNSVVTNLQKMLKVLVGERYELSFAPDAKTARVLADPGQIEQVVLNLVINARDAMPEGGSIEISTAETKVNQRAAAEHGVAMGRYIRLAIKDTGCGMDADTLSRIFQPFFTTKEVGKGTGLGLSIVYNAVKQSGGFIDVTSAPGQGSTFFIHIPHLSARAATPGVRVTRSDKLRGTETVLVVEDEEGVGSIVRDALSSRGYRVLNAKNGEDALRVLQEHRDKIQLVIADVVMPKLGGLDLALRLQAAPLAPKVLLMSGYTDRMNEIEEADLPFLRKPFTADELVQSLQTLLEDAPKILQTVPA